MPQVVTLELPDSALHRAQETAERTGRSVESVLTEWIKRVAASDDFSQFTPDAKFQVYTLFGSEDTAQALYEFLKPTNGKKLWRS
jgi:hypothetical protein